MVNCQEPAWVFQSSEPSLCFLTPSSQPNPTTLSHRTCMFISSLHPAWAGDQLPTCSKHLPNSRIQSPEVLAGPDGMSGKASEELETSQSLKPPWNLPRSDSVLGAELTDASSVQFPASESLLFSRGGRSQRMGSTKERGDGEVSSPSPGYSPPTAVSHPASQTTSPHHRAPIGELFPTIKLRWFHFRSFQNYSKA